MTRQPGSARPRVAVFIGTRPEAIKLCPLVLVLRREFDFATEVCATAQHRRMLDQVLSVFEVVPDVDLDLMRPDQSLDALAARALIAIGEHLSHSRPDLVLVQGDTTSVLCAALAAFHHQIPVGHVEAGLRTGDPRAPFPEEMNRVLTTRLADLHFAPTESARDNLLREGVDARSVFVTGNTVIDALQCGLARIRVDPPEIPGLPADWREREEEAPLVLVTGHRRENFGPRLEAICRALAGLAAAFPRACFVYPVHDNPRVREPVRALLGGLPNVHLLEPLAYLPFVALMAASSLILADSGGIQEEAPCLGKPVLILRDKTERAEIVTAGCGMLVGASKDQIMQAASRLLADPGARRRMSRAASLYGDGDASGRIAAVCRAYLEAHGPLGTWPDRS
jgi:UDP-N-acetylglucosamine 2-epimerase (non-hydrolysing)